MLYLWRQEKKGPIQMRYRKRSKSEIRLWLKTSEGKQWLEQKIEEKCKLKAEKRRKKDIATMRRYGLKFSCAKCVHGIGKHCDGGLPSGCPSYHEVGKMLPEIR